VVVSRGQAWIKNTAVFEILEFTSVGVTGGAVSRSQQRATLL